MAAHDAGLNPTRRRLAGWLDDWRHWLDLWLDCGVAAPGPEARAALQRWVDSAELAGWRQPLALARTLLDEGRAPAERADALLDLMLWQQTAQRCHDADGLAAAGEPPTR